jgi:hypothetical protein
MAARGVRTVATAETDPVVAVSRFLSGTLAPPDSHDDADGCNCSCDSEKPGAAPGGH